MNLRRIRLSTWLARGVLALAVAAASWINGAQAQMVSVCGSLENHYGPFDYRKEREGRLRVVEKFHFTPRVESLVGGESGDIGGDLNYTLLTAPNHHRALMTSIRYAEKLKTPRPPKFDYSIECFLERGLRFQPDDTVVRVLYARYLGKLGRKADGVALLNAGMQFTGENPLSHYNFGLTYLELGEPEQALREAHKARELGLQRTELEEQLKSAGKWQEPQ